MQLYTAPFLIKTTGCAYERSKKTSVQNASFPSQTAPLIKVAKWYWYVIFCPNPQSAIPLSPRSRTLPSIFLREEVDYTKNEDTSRHPFVVLIHQNQVFLGECDIFFRGGKL